MTHFGILCPATDGHLNPMIALGRELQRRGNRVTLFAIANVESKILAAGNTSANFRGFNASGNGMNTS